MFRFGRELGVCQGEPYKNTLQNLKLWSLKWVKIASYCWLKIIRLKKVNNIITAEMPASFVPHEHADTIYFFQREGENHSENTWWITLWVTLLH